MFKDIDRKDRTSGLKKTQSHFKDIDRKDRVPTSSLCSNRFNESIVHSEFEQEIKIILIKRKI